MDGIPLDGFIAKDDIELKSKMTQLIESVGMRAIDAEPRVRTRQLEASNAFEMNAYYNYLAEVCIMDNN